MATRTSYIVQDVMGLLGDPTGRKYPRGRVLRVLGQVQEDVCREGLAIRFEGTLTMVADQEVYDVNGIVWKVEKFIVPSTWTQPFEVVTDVNVWARLKNEITAGTQPNYGMIIDKWLHLWWPPVTAGEVINIIGYALPELVLTEAAAPEVGAQWDEALKFGTVARLNPMLKDAEGNSFDRLYEKAMMKAMGMNMQESIEGQTVQQHWSRSLNF